MTTKALYLPVVAGAGLMDRSISVESSDGSIARNMKVSSFTHAPVNNGARLSGTLEAHHNPSARKARSTCMGAVWQV
ncbi:hypothetical protein U1Q18_036192 [Sarracenia purpurea var. burkii]